MKEDDNELTSFQKPFKTCPDELQLHIIHFLLVNYINLHLYTKRHCPNLRHLS